LNKQELLFKKILPCILFVAAFVAFFLLLSLDYFSYDVNTNNRLAFNKTIAYAITTLLSFLLLLGYCTFIKEKKLTFLLLFTSVFIINLGYLFGSSSHTLEEALLANKISYVGAVFLPLVMLVIIMDECKHKRHPIFLASMILLTSMILLLTMTPGYANWYYQSVELTFVNGGAQLIKTYGRFHKLYFLYLFLYFGLMVASIVVASIKKTNASPKLLFSLLTVVFANILIWFVEQKIHFNFEFLSISYIVTEMHLLSMYNIAESSIPAQTMDMSSDPTENSVPPCFVGPPAVNADIIGDESNQTYFPSMEEIIAAWPAVAQLTTREVEVFKELIQNKKRKDIAEELCVSENTIKKHTSNIFTKLNVSCRADIMNKLLQIEHSIQEKESAT